MSEKFTDETIDKMLNNYFSRKPSVTFSADFEKEKRSVFDMKANFIFRAAAVCACFAVLGVGIFSAVHGQKVNNSPEQIADNGDSESSECNAFVLTAYAADIDTQGNWNTSMKSFPRREKGIGEFGGVYYSEENIYFLDDNPDDNEKSSLISEALDRYLASGESKWNGYDVIKKRDTSFEFYGINLNIDGENILTYDVECESGEVFCYSDANYDETINLPFDGEHFVEWMADIEKIEKEVFLEIEGGMVTAGTVDRRVEAAEKALQTAEDYTYYFGDTLTVTAHFKDGTAQRKHIYITLDSEGNYIINYDR